MKLTKKQINLIQYYWMLLQKEINIFEEEVNNLEQRLSEDTGIDDIEFFKSDDGYVGVGNASRTMNLIQLEKNGDIINLKG